MPEVIVRKRVGRRSGDWRFRLNRWFYRNRPQVAVIAAFLVAGVVGLLVVAAGLSSMPGKGAEDASTAATPLQ